jgi:hypothetical protein
MRIHSLFLSSAALVASATVGLAADLPSKKAAPVDYVKVCTITSFTGFVIPGTDVCLKIGGFVRYQYNYDSVAHGFYSNGTAGYGSSFKDGANVYGTGRNISVGGQTATASAKFDARATTEYGLLRSFADIRVNNAGGAAIDKAYIQFGPWSFGKFQSFFDFYADGYNNVGAFGSDTSVIGVAYTATISPNFFATIALEDRGMGAFAAPVVGAPNLVTANAVAGSVGGVAVGGYRVPDAVAQLLYTDTWGSAQLSAALHQVRYSVAGVAAGAAGTGITALNGQGDSKVGWAVQGGLKFNLPMLGAGDTAYLQGAYSEGALNYVGLGGLTSNNPTQTIIGQSDAIAVGPNGSVKLTKAYNVLAGIDHFWTPNFDTSVFASYTKVDYASGYLTGQNQLQGTGLRARDFDLFQVGAQANWAVVKNLMVSVTGLYYQIDAKTLATDYVTTASGAKVKGVDDTSNGFAARVRVQRSF